jgi:hypothetical protein
MKKYFNQPADNIITEPTFIQEIYVTDEVPMKAKKPWWKFGKR